MTLYQELYGDKKRLYSCHVTKLNRHLKSHSRVFVLCDKHFYRLTGDYRLAKKGRVDLEMVTGISISTGSDQTLVVHCVVSNVYRSGNFDVKNVSTVILTSKS